MTKHLEERLSEAFDAAARTVPDNAVPPELFPAPAAERRWVPVLVIGLAMAAVVIAVTIPIAISRSGPPPASVVCPSPPAVAALTYAKRDFTDLAFAELNKLPFGPPPRVPFTMVKDSSLKESYLEDGGIRVPIEAGHQVSSIGRVECGWAVYRQSGKVSGQVTAEAGVLRTDGQFRSFGPISGEGASLSPDGSQLAYLAPASRGGAQVVTVSVATGKRLAATPAGGNSRIVGWNSHGVWFLQDQDRYLTKLWQPGAAPITVDTDEHQVTAYRGTDRMLLSDPPISSKPSSCVRVATLESTNKLKTIEQKCGGTTGTLSPDGKVLVMNTGDGAKGFLVDGGLETGLDVSSTLLTVDHDSVWEDPTHLLDSAALGQDRMVTMRCNVLTGACERIQDSPQEGVPAGPYLSFP